MQQPHYHSYNYELVVKIKREIDPEAAMLWMQVFYLDHEIIELFDHRSLNLIPKNSGIKSNRQEYCRCDIQLLKQNYLQKRLGIILYETERNYLEYND